MRRLLLLLVLGAAACTAPPVPPPAPPAPVVAVVRDATGLRGCAGTARLAPDLVSATTALPAGAGCTWSDPAGGSVLRADVRAAGGLDALYAASSQFRAFRTGELDGAPTVVTTPDGDPSCSLHAALSAAEVLTVQIGPATGPVPDPCAAASAVAVRLLDAMPRR